MGWESTNFWNRHAKSYAERPVANQEAYQHKLDITREYMTSDSDVMEFGCGTGTTALYHAPAVKHIDAFDLSDGMIDIAKSKQKAKNADNVSFNVSSVENMEPIAKKYDVIMGHSILHLLRDIDTTIEKVYTMLKPGGVFISSTVCIADRMGFMRFILPIATLIRIAPNVQIIKGSWLVDVHKKAGFELAYEWRPTAKSMSLFLVAKKRA